MRRSFRIAAALLPLWVTHAMAGLQLAPNGRTLVDGAGQPVLLVGDAPWSLITQLSLPDAELYLEDRAAKGFNAIMVGVIEHEFCTNPPANAYGESPFPGAPFTSFNEAYFAHVDAVLSAAARRGITVLLAPVYLGFLCGDEGWCAEIEAASLADMHTWGRYLGERYRGYDNIVWLIGGDADPSPVRAQLREVVAGIRELDTVHLITAHTQPESIAVEQWPNEAWLQVNSFYSHHANLYVDAYDTYQATGTLPFFLIESTYENEHSVTQQQLRAQSYWSVLAGGFGHIFGNCPLWHFGAAPQWCGLSDWQAQLDSQGSLNMEHFGRLFRSRHWHQLVPDFENTVIIDGAGAWGFPDYALAATTADGSSIIAYLPTARIITVDANTIAGDTLRVWWYDPATGSSLGPQTIPRGTCTLSTPGTGDWVLVIDDASLGWPAPGQPVATASTPAPLDSPSWVELEPIQPNPSHGRSMVLYSLTRRAWVQVAIYNTAGERVRTLVDQTQAAGLHSVAWDGKDARGRPAASGIYYCNVRTPRGAASRPISLVR